MKRFSFARFKEAGITDLIIGICLLMLIMSTVIPAISSALLFYPPLTFAQPYRLVTSAFLHSGFWHFAFNMIALYMVGRQLEHGLGRWRYAVLYLISAIAGNTGVLAWAAVTGDWRVAVVGASGAVFGLFGALLAFAGVSGDNFKSIAILIGINLAYGFITPGISWQSHIAGFLGGYLMALLWRTMWRKMRKEHPALDALAAICVTSIITVIIYACLSA